MAEKDGRRSGVMLNRAPVLTLWAVVAEVLGFEHDEARTIVRAVTGLNAYSKGVSLGLFLPSVRGRGRSTMLSSENRPEPRLHSSRNIRKENSEVMEWRHPKTFSNS